MTYGERFDIKVYRNNQLIFDDTDEVISFETEATCTSERGEARIRFDGAKFPDIKVGDAIELFISSGGSELTKVFSGEIDEIRKVREEGELFYDIIAHDWSKLLSEKKVNLSFPTVENASTIAKNIVEPITKNTTPEKNERKITVFNVETMNKTRTLDFIGLTIYEALKKLSDYTLCDFYVDPDKDLHWFIRGTRSSNKTLTENDLQTYDLSEERAICNHAKVYGAPNRTAPEFDLDAWSDSKEGWYSAEVGQEETINVKEAPRVYNAMTAPGWDKYRNWTEETQDLTVDDFKKVTQEWSTEGTLPWLKDLDDHSIFVYAKTHCGKVMDYWTFSDPDENKFRNNLKEWKNVSLKFKSRHTTKKGETWTSQCKTLDDFTGHTGNIECVYLKTGYWALKIWYGNTNFGEAWKAWDLGTANVQVKFDLTWPDPEPYPQGAKLYLMYIFPTTDPWGAPIACLYFIKKGNGWHHRFYGKDKNDQIWELEDSKEITWEGSFDMSITVEGANTSNAKAILTGNLSGGCPLVKTGIDLTGLLIKNVVFHASWQDLGGFDPTGHKVYYSYIEQYGRMRIFATRRKTTFKASLFKYTTASWLNYSFDVYDHELEWTWQTLDITREFSDIDVLKQVRMKLLCDSSEGIEADGQSVSQIKFRHAVLFLKANVYYGTPAYLDSDDDYTYIETDKENAEDYAWTEFPFNLAGMTQFVSSYIKVKGLNATGTVPVSCKLIIKDPVTGSEIDLGSKTWAASETSWTVKTWNVTDYLDTEYKLQKTQLKFVKIGAEGKIRITYAYIDVTYIKGAGAIFLTDNSIKKAGNCSLKLLALYEPRNPGIITSSFWRDLPEPIVCQTIRYKEGFTKLAFAALINMYVHSSLSHWQRPSAKLDTFTVKLRDTSGNIIVYSAGDVYPETTFLCTPSPKKTEMKEVYIRVGEDAEADGLWTRLGPNFDWSSINRIEFFIKGATDTEVEGNPYLANIELWIDWLHFEEGRWFAEYSLPDDSPSIQMYGRSLQEIFDKTCFSEEDCFYRAKYYVESHKYPTKYLENVEIDYSGMEQLKPGQMISFNIPEGSFSTKIAKITWIWEGDLFGKLDLDNEGLQPKPEEADPEIPNVPSTIDASEEPPYHPSQRRLFTAVGRYWVFYQWDQSPEEGYLVYKTSKDGTNWSDRVIVRLCFEWGDFDIYFDGVYLHYGVIREETLYYRKGKPNVDGSITWLAPEQTVPVPLPAGDLFVCVTVTTDSSNYPYLACSTQEATENGYPWITKSSKNDGTWVTDSDKGFPYKLNTSPSPLWVVSCLRLGNKILAIYGKPSNVYSQCWNGSSWSSEVKANTTDLAYDPATVLSFCAVSDGTSAYLAYPTTTNKLVCTKYDSSSNSWSSEEDVFDNPESPSLSFDKKTGNIYCFWRHGNKVYYKRRIEGTWESTATEWISESTLKEETYTSERNFQNRITLIYFRDPNYTIKFYAMGV